MPSKQASPRGGEGRSVAERMAREIIPQWTNASAANTMEYENALEAQMMEGHGPVEGLLHAVYTGDVNETVEGSSLGDDPGCRAARVGTVVLRVRGVSVLGS